MSRLGKVILHIPAREGSKRLRHKNLRLLGGRPMISYAIDAAVGAKVTDNIYVNTDSLEIIQYVRGSYPGVNIYERDKALADDATQSDHFNADIIAQLSPDTLIMINPVCPLITAVDVQDAVMAYESSDCDTLITSNSTQMQVFCEDTPVNIKLGETLAPTQDNAVVNILNWAITIWDAASFIDRFDRLGAAALGKKRLYHPLNVLKSIKVSHQEDLELCESLISSKARGL